MRKLFNWYTVFTIVVFVAVGVTLVIIRSDESIGQGIKSFLFASALLPLIAIGIAFIVDRSKYLAMTFAIAYIVFAALEFRSFDFEKIAHNHQEKISFLIYYFSLLYTSISMVASAIIFFGLDRELTFEEEMEQRKLPELL